MPLLCMEESSPSAWAKDNPTCSGLSKTFPSLIGKCFLLLQAFQCKKKPTRISQNGEWSLCSLQLVDPAGTSGDAREQPVPTAHRPVPTLSPFPKELPLRIQKIKCFTESQLLQKHLSGEKKNKCIFSFAFSFKNEEFPSDPSVMNCRESFSLVQLNSAHLRGWKITENYNSK